MKLDCGHRSERGGEHKIPSSSMQWVDVGTVHIFVPCIAKSVHHHFVSFCWCGNACKCMVIRFLNCFEHLSLSLFSPGKASFGKQVLIELEKFWLNLKNECSGRPNCKCRYSRPQGRNLISSYTYGSLRSATDHSEALVMKKVLILPLRYDTAYSAVHTIAWTVVWEADVLLNKPWNREQDLSSAGDSV